MRSLISSEVDAETVDMDSVMQFEFQFAGDLGAALHVATVVIGDRLGLYKALAEGPTTAAGLSARTGCDQRYLHEWLDAQAASGYCRYDPDSESSQTAPRVKKQYRAGNVRVHRPWVTEPGLFSGGRPLGTVSAPGVCAGQRLIGRL
jgi:hypothetical protein